MDNKRRVTLDKEVKTEQTNNRSVENAPAVRFALESFLFREERLKIPKPELSLINTIITEKKEIRSRIAENDNENNEDTLTNYVLEDSYKKKKIGNLPKQSNMEKSPVETPWGYYTVIHQGPHYKIKKIIVFPGQRLSMQMHYHRNEYWLEVEGTARVTVGDDVFLLHPNQSTYIPIRTKHRLENIGETPLEVIELQNGDCISEEDIIRFEDDYDRN